MMVMTMSAEHFMSDAVYRQKVDSAFKAKMQLVGPKFYQLKGLHASAEEQEALHFLYAYMPVADATDYPTSYHLSNIRAALRTRRDDYLQNIQHPARSAGIMESAKTVKLWRDCHGPQHFGGRG